MTTFVANAFSYLASDLPRFGCAGLITVILCALAIWASRDKRPEPE